MLKLFFGSCAILAYLKKDDGTKCYTDLTLQLWNKIYEKLFGGFDSRFYSAYDEEYPLDNEYQYRENVYKLYHVLNHLNLFEPITNHLQIR